MYPCLVIVRICASLDVGLCSTVRQRMSSGREQTAERRFRHPRLGGQTGLKILVWSLNKSRLQVFVSAVAKRGKCFQLLHGAVPPGGLQRLHGLSGCWSRSQVSDGSVDRQAE